ncbi:hypothetical protein AOC36_09435 [Erysipelothrix larvae]|uniref:Haloacid dehalogenase n=1 Tax=Erysipelothrix larvae TaxID=1514105 RepID=A0A0X8H179_9FIRM|nr:Cof-type HAD-IIB family hydrolase [Erysipelothrix larvae]AMC94196.1 hypothetical protein AOC36_09435 [Erysipelothrix larvae]
MIRCIVSDLDGTLVKTSMNVVDEKTIAYLKQCQKQGMLVILASGRPLSMMEDLGEILELDLYGGYLIGHNGYQVLDYKQNKTYESSSLLPKEVVEDVFNFSKTHLGYLTLITHKASYNFGSKLVRHVKRLYFYIRLRKTAHGFLREYNDFKSLNEVQEPIFKIGFASYSRRALVQLQNEMDAVFGDSIEVVRVNSRYIDITPKGITKGQALKTLMDKEGLLPEEVVAFGDAENDVSMFEVVGTAVAMDNALDSVKSKADAITDSNMKNGVLNYLLKAVGHIDE